MLVIVVIRFDAYPSLVFSDMACHLEGKGIDVCFLFAQCCLIVRRQNLEVVSKRLLHQLVEILG